MFIANRELKCLIEKYLIGVFCNFEKCSFVICENMSCCIYILPSIWYAITGGNVYI